MNLSKGCPVFFKRVYAAGRFLSIRSVWLGAKNFKCVDKRGFASVYYLNVKKNL